MVKYSVHVEWFSLKKLHEETNSIHEESTLDEVFKILVLSKKIWDRTPLSTVFPTVINLANRKVPGVHSNIISLEKSLYTLAD